MIDLLLVEDNERLRPALMQGLTKSGQVDVIHACATGEEAIEFTLHTPAAVALMDVQLANRLNGIEAAVAIRREYPRFPVVFYSIQDDDAYYRAFRNSGILSHYAYVRKSNYLLPSLILPLLRDAISGRSFIDPDIEYRVHEVRHKDENDPMALLEPHEQAVARMVAEGMTNDQIAARLGFRDKRTISRVNGQIYTTWGLNRNRTDEKVARTRVALIVQAGRLIEWDSDGGASVLDEK